MDDPAIDAADHLHALSALGRINLVSRTAARLAEGVVRVAGSSSTGPLVVVDVACGGGDVTVDLARRLAERDPRRATEVVGVDLSAFAIDRSRRLARARRSDATFVAADVVATGCPPCDVAVSSLFLHHLDDTDAVALLRSMATAARRGIAVSDLLRTPLGLALAVVGTTLLSRSRVARIDGPLSVRAARTVAEYRVLMARAGLQGGVVRRVWPERVLLEWRRAGGER